MEKNLALIDTQTGEVLSFIDEKTDLSKTITQIQKENNIKKYYEKFYMVYKNFGPDLINLQLQNPTASAVLTFLVNVCDGYNTAKINYQLIEDALQISKSTVQRAIDYLKKNGFIVTKKSNNVTAYIINPSICWSSWEKNKEFCDFPWQQTLFPNKNTDRINKKIKEAKALYSFKR